MPSGLGVAFLVPVEDPGKTSCNFKMMERIFFWNQLKFSRLFIHHLANAKKSTLICSRGYNQFIKGLKLELHWIFCGRLKSSFVIVRLGNVFVLILVALQIFKRLYKLTYENIQNA